MNCFQKNLFLGLIFSGIFLGGCAVNSEVSVWRNVAKGVDFYQHSYSRDEMNGTIEVFRLDMSRFTLKFHNSRNAQLISEWGGGKSGIFINGAYFNEDFSPSGFLVIDGKKISERIFDQNKSGLLIAADSFVQLRDLSLNPIREENFDNALQSYPFLIKNYQPAVNTNSGLKSRRTAIGIDEKGNIYLFISSFYYLSLYEFMEEIMAMNFEVRDVLNLDGGTSSGLMTRFEKYDFMIDSLTKVPMILEFEPKDF